MLNPGQIFVVVDIEADGPAVGLNSMLSLAAVATTMEKETAQFYQKLTPLEDATQDAGTMAWWGKHTAAWEEATSEPQSPRTVMETFCDWVVSLDAEAIFAASPVGLDYTFVSWYLYRFAPFNPFVNDKNAVRTLDIRSYIAGTYGFNFDDSSRLKWPASLTEGMPAHTHRAIDDARGYAFLLRKLLRERRNRG